MQYENNFNVDEYSDIILCKPFVNPGKLMKNMLVMHSKRDMV